VVIVPIAIFMEIKCKLSESVPKASLREIYRIKGFPGFIVQNYPTQVEIAGLRTFFLRTYHLPMQVSLDRGEHSCYEHTTRPGRFSQTLKNRSSEAL